MNVEVHRRKNSLGQAFLVPVPLVAAAEWGGSQQEGSKELKPNVESPGCDHMGRQAQNLADSEGI
jgi:hypothetical protein